jgi:hypothetical protein
MRQAAMARSFHWSGAAAEYEALYRRLLGQSPARTVPTGAKPRRPPRARTPELQAAA